MGFDAVLAAFTESPRESDAARECHPAEFRAQEA